MYTSGGGVGAGVGRGVGLPPVGEEDGWEVAVGKGDWLGEEDGLGETEGNIVSDGRSDGIEEGIELGTLDGTSTKTPSTQ